MSEPTVAWDAGDLGCGEIIIALRARVLALAPGSLLEVTARDLGAPEDLPSWCRLTGHELVKAEHPVYLIRRRIED
jgi:tRNA 2-thiouridine synthesizing protein A